MVSPPARTGLAARWGPGDQATSSGNTPRRRARDWRAPDAEPAVARRFRADRAAERIGRMVRDAAPEQQSSGPVLQEMRRRPRAVPIRNPDDTTTHHNTRTNRGDYHPGSCWCSSPRRRCDNSGSRWRNDASSDDGGTDDGGTNNDGTNNDGGTHDPSSSGTVEQAV